MARPTIRLGLFALLASLAPGSGRRTLRIVTVTRRSAKVRLEAEGRPRLRLGWRSAPGACGRQPGPWTTSRIRR